MINFLAEITEHFNNEIHLTPSMKYPKRYNIYELDIGEHPTKSYFLDWGGKHDNISGEKINLYISKYLLPVNTPQELISKEYTMLTANGKVYVNLPKHPWLYALPGVNADGVEMFLSAPLDGGDPSNNSLNGVDVPIKLETPSVPVKLADNMNGIVLSQSFNLAMINNDGYFDLNKTALNTPIELKKTSKDKPEYADFKAIRKGLVESTRTSMDKHDLTAADSQRALEENVCGLITKEKYPTAIEKYINKNMPVLYGRKRVKLLKLNDNFQYVAAELISAVHAVYDKDGNIINAQIDNGVITATAEAETADVTGVNDNKISEIIKDLITRKSGVPWGETNWNIEEINQYDAVAPRINIVFESGSVKNAIDKVLKSDMAYFIQQNSGLFTLRKYGYGYGNRVIDAKHITKKPEISDGSGQKKYFSSCVIAYAFNNDANISYLYDAKEAEAELIYRKVLRKTFETDLIGEDDARNLAELLSERYTAIQKEVKLAVGFDASEYELLDMVECEININGRKLIDKKHFVITETDPAQDTFTLETFDVKKLRVFN